MHLRDFSYEFDTHLQTYWFPRFHLRSQAKHERNFMAELLDQFLASLEEFGERQLAVEDCNWGQTQNSKP